MNILGVRIDELRRLAAREQVHGWLSEDGFRRVATVNPEFLVRAHSDRRFRDVLNRADLTVADGVGVSLVARLTGGLVDRYPGAELMADILEFASARSLPVFLALRKDGLSSYSETQAALCSTYPDLIIDGVEIASDEMPSAFVFPARSRVLLCNFGAPRQEYFCEALRKDPGGIRLAVGIGGAFDFFTGKRRRAPSLLRALGLEWLWRLILQPSRIFRILNATVKFPLLAVYEQMKRGPH